MEKAGHIFSAWDKLAKTLRGKFLYIFLDYDGTLASIAESPEKAVISERTAGLLRELSGMPERKIAIISGRGLKDVMKKAGLKKLTYAGNHGLEIKGPGVKVLKAVPAKYKRALTRLKGVLVKKLSSIEGAFLEDKNFSVTVHYRQVAKKDIPGVKAVLREALDVPGVSDAVKVRSAKMAVEIRPPVEWDKGRAVLLLLSRQKAKLAGKKRKIIPIYAGDDATDEDAFRALRSVGVTISVGNKEGTSAEYFLKDTDEVEILLRKILDLGIAARGSHSGRKVRKGH